MRQRFLLIPLLTLLIFNVAPERIHADSNAFEWHIGEEFTYKVKWSFIRLGTLKMKMVDTVHIDGMKLNKINFYIDSNPMIFFVNMHNIYETYIDDSLQVHLFYADEKIDGVLYETEYRFDYADSVIHVTMTDVEDTTKTIYKEIPFNVPILDGTGMIYYVRSKAHIEKKDTLYSIYEAEIDKVLINFTGKQESVDLLNDQEIDSFFIDGRLLIKGIAGVTGPYKGWFSADSQRVPLKAELKVFIGSVKVELESWENWLGTQHSEGS